MLKPGALGSGSDAGIILSRARLVATILQLEVSDFSDPGEIVRLQFAALTRQGKDWAITHASTCHVRFHVSPSHTPRNCGISNPDGQFPFLPDRRAKPITANSGISIGNHLRGGQLLAGALCQQGPARHRPMPATAGIRYVLRSMPGRRRIRASSRRCPQSLPPIRLALSSNGPASFMPSKWQEPSPAPHPAFMPCRTTGCESCQGR